MKTETTETETTTEAAATPAQGEAETAEPMAETETETADTTASKSSREAAKYRARLREVEAERDELTSQLTTWRKSEAQTMAASVLGDGADLWRDGLDVSDLVDESGLIDTDKVTAAAKAVGKLHPTWLIGRSAPPKPPGGSGAARGGESEETGWGKVLGQGRIK